MSERTLLPAPGELPPLYPSRGFDQDPLGVMAEGHRQYGPVFRMMVDEADTVLVGTWAGLGELFVAERGRLEVLNTALVHDLFGRALFNLTGDGHAEARRRLRPALSARALPRYVPALLVVTGPVAAGWARQGVADLYLAAREVTHAMSARVLLGIHPADTDTGPFAADFGRFITATGAPPGERRFSDARYWAGRGARRRLHTLFTRRAVAARLGTDPGSALPGLVAAFEDAPKGVGPLADHLLALLIAARETTASLITWCLIELARHREYAGLAAAEAHGALADPRLLVRRDALPILRAVLAETQRLHSPNLLSVRETVCPVSLGGYRVPAGMRVAYSPSAGHLDPRVFPQPHAFRPGRFLVRQSPGARLRAFGGGAHACLGRPLAELMTLTALSCALHQGLPRLPSGPPDHIRYRPAKAPAAPVPFALDRQESAS
ncbi:cytochrome P450 [Sphaerimonospora thailandensis]|uniref:Cytochrome P450 n=1 Tax=Sphaerimonospora thailandensis TaxID=795644 RepID=A0A8J3R8U7_9ACTN|nr:cytochrome P450 [Sphaerimonospora thailandensis]GIH69891.1 cytochrome P450 [Sphaerimonospora thailandensis]